MSKDREEEVRKAGAPQPDVAPPDGAELAAGVAQPQTVGGAQEVAADPAPPVGGAQESPVGGLREERLRECAAILLTTLVREGLGGLRGYISERAGRYVSRRETRRAILEAIEYELGAVDDLYQAFTLKSLEKKYKRPDVKEIVEIINNGIRSAAKGIARTVSDVGLSAAEKMTAVRKAVGGFFRDLAEKLAASRIAAAAAIANGFSKMASNIDSGAVSIANAMTAAGLRVGTTADRAGAAVRRAGVHISEQVKDVRSNLAQKIAPPDSPANPRASQREQRIGDIDATLGTAIAVRELAAQAAKKGRDDALKARDAQRKQFRRGKKVRSSRLLHDHGEEMVTKSVPESGAPLSPSATPRVAQTGSVTRLRGG